MHTVKRRNRQTGLAFLGIACLTIAFVGIGTAKAQTTLAEFTGADQQRLKSRAFKLDQAQVINFSISGSPLQKSMLTKIGESFVQRDYSVNLSAWIINSNDRSTVWELDNGTIKALDDEGGPRLNDEISLPAGEYEVYIFPIQFVKSVSIIGLIKYNTSEDNSEFKQEIAEFLRTLKITVTGKGTSLPADFAQQRVASLQQQAFVSLPAREAQRNLEAGFSLANQADIRVYAVGELYMDGRYDYAWIEDVNSGEHVWEMNHDNSAAAGGAAKNRRVNKLVSLPAGDYVAHFASDDSHYYGNWNDAPPHDPAFWGLHLFNENGKAQVSSFNIEQHMRNNLIVDMRTQRDYAFQTRGFSLDHEQNVRIQATGEGMAGHMVDYGYIVDASTGKRVWEMRFSESQHAGGAFKNRVVRSNITLPAGSYVAYYLTDDSHSYDSWNDSPPSTPADWGLMILGGRDFDKASVKTFNPSDTRLEVAAITQIGDDQMRSQNFTLDEMTTLNVVAIGEGNNGRMYDYAWVTRAGDGQVVWEMTYSMTSHAGGSYKNRQYVGTISLPAGSYVLHYRSDDSHSFAAWNDNPPTDAGRYGVSLYHSR